MAKLIQVQSPTKKITVEIDPGVADQLSQLKKRAQKSKQGITLNVDENMSDYLAKLIQKMNQEIDKMEAKSAANNSQQSLSGIDIR